MNRMWKLLTIVMALGLLVSIIGFASPVPTVDAKSNDSAADRLLVKFEPGMSGNDKAQVHSQVGGKVETIIQGIGVNVVTVPHGQGATKSAAYRMQKGVRYVEPDGVVQVADVPDDPYFNEQWGMTKVQAPEAWDITQGSPDVIIAILDTGIDMDHPDLAAKIISDANFSESPTSNDIHSHGTHVAGIAAAITDNGNGVAGLGGDCSLMNAKVVGDNGSGYYSWIAEGIIWAADNGADVINLSVGGQSPSDILEDAVDYAWSKGVVVVAGAGNNGWSAPFWPAYYDNCIAVGATMADDSLASFSQHGSWVDVAAPGSGIYSTVPNDQYDYKQGTSMASPHVAGLAGLLFSTTTDSNGNGRVNDEVRHIIEATCDDVGIDVAYGRINAYEAVNFPLMAETPAPSDSMWVESVSLTPGKRHLSITVKVTNHEPVHKVEVTLELMKDGAAVSEFSGSTNKAGEISFRLRNASDGEYIATITALSHKSYVWNESESVNTSAYTLSR